MKFWELISAFRSETPILTTVFFDPQWHKFQTWYTQSSALINTQNREILDAEVPDALARAVASKSALRFWYYPDMKLLRLAKFDYFPEQARQMLTALEVYDRFGGSWIEEVLEKGSSWV